MMATAGTAPSIVTKDRGIRLPLAVTMGDPAGIGLDIVATAWAARHAAPMPCFVLIGDPEALEARARELGVACDIDIVDTVGAVGAGERLRVLPVRVARKVVAGRADPENAAAVIRAIELAVEETALGRVGAIVTAPISKATLYAAGFAHPGHTEFLGELAARHYPGEPSNPVMMLASDELRVVPVTVHIPLSAVPGAVTGERIKEVCRIAATDLRRRFGVAYPRLAVAGLNPHAGEDGNLGTEDRDVIAPAVAALRAEGLSISGPHPADTMFHPAARARYDAAICMYHDQALVPLKTLAFDTGVNVTLGLPFVRISPDHGTAFDIAGTGRASAASFVAALRLADQLCAQPCATAKSS